MVRRPQVPPAESLGKMRETQDEAERRLRDLERTDGSQYVRALEKIKSLIAGLSAQVAEYIGVYSYTRAQIESLSWMPTLWPAKGGTGTTNVHNTTSGGVQLQVFVRPDGQLTVGASTERLKTDIRAWDLDVDLFLSMVPRMFRWRDDIETAQTSELAVVADDGGPVDQVPEAPLDYGLIAEEAEAAGLVWLVRYGPDGRPEGIQYQRVQIALLAVARHQQGRLQEQQTQIDDLEQRMTALERKE